MRPRCAELIELTDGVVHLRSPDARDVEAIAAPCQDPAIQELTAVPSPDGRAGGEAFVEQVVPAGGASRTSLTWEVRDASSDQRALEAGRRARGVPYRGSHPGYAVQRDGRWDAWVGTLLATDARPSGVDFEG